MKAENDKSQTLVLRTTKGFYYAQLAVIEPKKSFRLGPVHWQSMHSSSGTAIPWKSLKPEVRTAFQESVWPGSSQIAPEVH